MRHLLAAPDKFRGTATAREIAEAMGRAAEAAGWTADLAPMADGGEGTLEVVGGEVRHTRVAGPLGEPVDAEWRLVRAAAPGQRPTAVIEMARAAGRALLPGPRGDAPLRADTTGVGQLVMAAVEEGAGRIVVAVGGSATTDGGWGAVSAIGDAHRLQGADLVVACDVRTLFVDAARVFGPQKGATRSQVELLTARLEALADRYLARSGVDVRRLEGSGAAGGLAGGLATLGASLVPGFHLIAELVGLPGRLSAADLVVTGEGRLDAGSLEGKVVGGILELAPRPVVCVVGQADPETVRLVAHGFPAATVLSLVDTVGRARALEETTSSVEAALRGHLAKISARS